MAETGNQNDLQASKAQVPSSKEEPKKQEAKEEEFSLRWHLKVLAVIYVGLGIFYAVLKVVLK